MMKGIIIIDIPNSCNECKFCSSICCRVQEDINVYRFKKRNTKPDCCPIKSLPKKKKVFSRVHSPVYSIGWNECLNGILKGGR